MSTACSPLTMCVLVAVGLVTASAPARAQPSGAPQQALSLHDEAQALYQQGRYREAALKLKRAVQLDPDAIELHYNLGLIHEKTGDLAAALVQFRVCLALEHNPAEKVRLERTIARIEGASRHATPNKPSPAAPAPAPTQPRLPPAVGPHPAVIALSAASGVGLLIGSSLALYASGRDPGHSASTGPTTSYLDLQHDADEAHRAAIAADVMLGLGTAAGVTALVLAITLPGLANSGKGGTTAGNVRVSLGPTSANLAIDY